LKEKIKKAVTSALLSLGKKLAESDPSRGPAPVLRLERFVVEKPANPAFGHFSTNAAMVFSKDFAPFYAGVGGNKALALAADLAKEMDAPGLFEAIEIKGPGFVNFRVAREAWIETLREIIAAGADYGKGEPTGKRILVEFVSSNPTGPLHVGHGRGAAWGDAVANILAFLGNEVEREYYVNDAGNQINTLGRSLLFRLRNPAPDAEVPDGLYKGLYVLDLSGELKNELPPEFFERPDGELVPALAELGAEKILADMKGDLEHFGLRYDNWFSEKSLYAGGDVARAIETLKKNGHTYERDGALFFKSSDFGDDKDRVLVKSNGDHTYFASDVAYHDNKLKRGHDLLIDLLGADHGGYQARVSAAIQALGHPKEKLKVVLYQLVKLLRGGETVKMSTRAGEFVPFKMVLDEVSPDAARFLYLSQSHDSPIEFDLEAAKAKNRDNPVYYVQYLCARIFQVAKKAEAIFEKHPGPANLDLLREKDEIDLAARLESFPEAVRNAGAGLSPHLLASWLAETAGMFHRYYGEHRMVDENDPELSKARVRLALAVRAIAGRGLSLLGMGVPERMD
jgi:arginyl-tRNA synthetase